MRLSEFLIRLALDPDLIKRFQEDPDGLAREFDLAPAQLALLRAGELRELRIKVEAELEVDGERVMMGTIHTMPITIHLPPDTPPPPTGS